MDVDKIAHALGAVFCHSPLGDFDLAPGTMHVEENEEIDRTNATIHVIGTFELTQPHSPSTFRNSTNMESAIAL